MSSQQVAVVTGANSGIGRATAIHLAQQGMRVFGTVRTVSKADKLLAMAVDAGVTIEIAELDVGSDESVRVGFEQILTEVGGVDHLVNSAGVGGNAVAEECSSEMYNDVFNINVTGAVRCAQQVLPRMRDRGSGTIVNITSVAGRIAVIAQSPYVASKWALEGVSESMAQELAPFGIRVAIVEPGVTKSSIFAKNVDAPNATGAYDQQYRRMFQFYAAGMTHATDALEVGKVIHHAITTDEPALRYSVSWAGDMAALHDRISDEDWLELGRITDDETYARRFEEVLGVDIRTP